MLIIILHYVNVFIWFTTDLFFYVFEVPLHWQANQPSVQCFSILQKYIKYLHMSVVTSKATNVSVYVEHVLSQGLN